MQKTTALALALVAALGSASPALARHGDDDGPGDDRGGAQVRGGDDGPGDDRGGSDDRGDDRARTEVRRAGSCGRGATSKLKLKHDDGRIEAEFEVDRNRAGERWRVTLSRGGRVLVRGTARTAGRSGSFSFERRISDLDGADRVTARAVGPDGLTCTATVTLPSA
ncbi:hypothetical protein [Conexibacter sp. SYSU D00693]|uniref:hypothetical protein n=1 Tax=Conexibacter sp. SYSU D00693 TaxID=2812560 RepID=UPI00196A8DC1|nr:hypothetical protein [Conexibacter sp. SYSU D00693]